MRGKAVVSVSDGLGALLDRYLELCESTENQRRLNHRGVSWSILPEFPLLAKVTGANLRQTYLEPEAFVNFTLANRVYRFERWRDCTPLSKDIAYWPGVILETSAFGMQPLYPEGEDPWIHHKPIVAGSGDIGGLHADFDPGDGVVRRMMETSEYCREKLPGFTVYVQAWDRAALGIAMDLMGTEDFLVNTITEPELIHELMKRVTDAGYAWSKARAAHVTELGFPVASSVSPGTGSGSAMTSSFVNLIADEVNMPMISLAMYEEFVHPYEKEAVDRAGTLNYYHSCGCLTPFLPTIATLRPMTQHVSHWTDLATAVRVYSGTKTLLQKTLHPLKDVLEPEAAGMDAILRQIRSITEGKVDYSVIANGIDSPTGNYEETLAKCDQWVEAADRCLG